MIISRESDYAVRIIRALSSIEIQPVSDICRNEHIPVQYAYKILKKLENSGLVKSFRGPKGGYQLCKNPDDITLYDIVIAVEDDLSINACMKQGFACPMNLGGHHCGVHKEFCRIQDNIVSMLKEKSLAEILR